MNYFEKEYILRTNDFTCFDELKPSVILDLFQDIAGHHADLLKIGFTDLFQKNLIWVLLRTKYDVIDNPKPYQKIIVATWPHEKGKLDFDRDYLILDENRNVLIKGTSKWVIVNYITRRLSLTRDINYSFVPKQEKNYQESFRKLDDIEIDNNFSLFEYKTLFTDLDHNGHVNNSKFSDFILNSIKLEKDQSIISFEINYLHELQKDQNIRNYFYKENNTYYFKGISNNEEIYLAKVILKQLF